MLQGCIEGDVRLAEGNTVLEGRVEICVDNLWGTVCSTGWGNNDAQVVCRQLGFSPTGIIFFCNFYELTMYNYNVIGASFTNDGSFGQGRGAIVMSNVHCIGTETRLVDCRRDMLSMRNCAHSSDVGVRCYERTGEACSFV